MQVLFDPLQYDHEPRFFLVNGTKTENPEVAERARMLLRALQQEGHAVKYSGNHGLGPVAAVHSPDYLKFLKNIYRRWQHIDGGSEEVIPNIHPNLSPGGYTPIQRWARRAGTWPTRPVRLALIPGNLLWQVQILQLTLQFTC